LTWWSGAAAAAAAGGRLKAGAQLFSRRALQQQRQNRQRFSLWRRFANSINLTLTACGHDNNATFQ